LDKWSHPKKRRIGGKGEERQKKERGRTKSATPLTCVKLYRERSSGFPQKSQTGPDLPKATKG